MGKRYPGVRRVQGVGTGQSSLSIVIPREIAARMKLKRGTMMRFQQTAKGEFRAYIVRRANLDHQHADE